MNCGLAMLGAGADAVTAHSLRPVQGLVRVVNQIFGRNYAVMRCHTQTTSDREQAGSRRNRRLRDGAPEVLRALDAIHR